MSTVLEAHSLRPEDESAYELGVSLFHTNALAAHRFDHGRGQWLASVRRSNLDEVADIASADFGDPNYIDGFARVDYAISDSTRASMHLLVANDSIAIDDFEDEESARADYHNSYVWGTLEHEWSPEVTGRLLLSYTDVSTERQGVVSSPGLRSGAANDERGYHVAGLRGDLTMESGAWLHRFGIEVRSLSARYDYTSHVEYESGYPFPGDPATVIDRDIVQSPSGDHVSAYFTSRRRFGELLSAELGLRWDEQTYVEDSDEQFGPRVHLMYQLNDTTQLRASWGRYQQAQGIDELQVEDGVTEFTRAQRADHLIFGVEKRLDDGYNVRIEAYRKDYAELRPRYENLFNSLSLLPELRGDRVRIAPESAESEGVELLLSRRTSEPWNGWVSYAWSQVEDRLQGASVRRSWDQTHAVSAGVTWTKSPWDAAVAVSYHTGWPTTPVRLVDPEGASPDVAVGPRNSDRLAAFASLDLRVARTFALRLGELTAFAEITNALDRGNPCCIDYTVVQDGATFRLEKDQKDWLPLIPSIGVLWKF